MGGPEGRGLQKIPPERLTAADAREMISKAKKATQSFMAECEAEGRWTTLCYLTEFGLLAKKRLFRQLTWKRGLDMGNGWKMDMGDLKRLDAENLRRNPKCKGRPFEIYAKIIDLFDNDGDKYLDFSEWMALDWVLMVEDKEGLAVINRYDEEGCREFNLNLDEKKFG